MPPELCFLLRKYSFSFWMAMRLYAEKAPGRTGCIRKRSREVYRRYNQISERQRGLRLSVIALESNNISPHAPPTLLKSKPFKGGISTRGLALYRHQGHRRWVEGYDQMCWKPNSESWSSFEDDLDGYDSLVGRFNLEWGSNGDLGGILVGRCEPSRPSHRSWSLQRLPDSSLWRQGCWLSAWRVPHPRCTTTVKSSIWRKVMDLSDAQTSRAADSHLLWQYLLWVRNPWSFNNGNLILTDSRLNVNVRPNHHLNNSAIALQGI